MAAYSSWKGYGMHWGPRLAYVLLYQSCCSLSFVVSIVYWGLLASNEISDLGWTQLFLSVSMHAFNVVIMGLEMFLSRNPFIQSHMFIYIPLVMLYVPYTFIVHLL
ncbi:hypothetical protein DSO57_1036521 [Entomophthora muscae]|uniref:Uncharacterized protein n=2 Tax=Entomophthora muscae TaxID=34485 RepID=A0ACC2RZL6_9FUNG|nr:hypothetical protein DSO57_1002846 [Entomophthora muscae]KAJ9075398.1 hypothetical protein DSO57_1036521 [Entomophthora muscae]